MVAERDGVAPVRAAAGVVGLIGDGQQLPRPGYVASCAVVLAALDGEAAEG